MVQVLRLEQNDILTIIQKVFKTSFEVDPLKVSLETRASDIEGWDSVGQLSLASELEDAFNISLEVDEFMDMENVRDIVRIVQTKLAAKK